MSHLVTFAYTRFLSIELTSLGTFLVHDSVAAILASNGFSRFQSILSAAFYRLIVNRCDRQQIFVFP